MSSYITCWSCVRVGFGGGGGALLDPSPYSGGLNSWGGGGGRMPS